MDAGVAGAGGSPDATVGYGGENVGHASNSGAWVARMLAGIIQTLAELSSTLGSYYQRQDAWTMEGTVAQHEMARVGSETLAATIRLDVATKEKAAQDVSVANAQNVDSFLHAKFTDEELYQWMVSQISTTYFQAYQLAYSTAKAAERCFERELALSDTGYVQFGYWDSLRQGLMGRRWPRQLRLAEPTERHLLGRHQQRASVRERADPRAGQDRVHEFAGRLSRTREQARFAHLVRRIADHAR